MAFLSSTLLLSLLTVCIALSVVMSLRFLHFPDMTIDGTVTTSGAIFAVTLVQFDSTAIALLAAISAGFLCGLITMFLHVYFGIGKLLSGILMFTALYSIDLRIMSGSNFSILMQTSWFDQLTLLENKWFKHDIALMEPIKLVLLTALISGLIFLLYTLYHLKTGIIIRAMGDNEKAVARMAIPTKRYKFLGLGLANAVAGLAGALIVSNQGFADVGMGTGSLVLGLAAVIIGEKIVGQFWGTRDLVLGLLLAALVGTIIYQGLWLLVLGMGLSPTDLKLFTTLLVILSFTIGKKASVFYGGRVF